jgi:hypothetical protein
VLLPHTALLRFDDPGIATIHLIGTGGPDIAGDASGVRTLTRAVVVQ